MGALRRLTPDEQVGLLFLILFGALMLVTLGAMLWSLRAAHDESGEAWARFVRDLRALWIGTVLFWLAWLSGPIGATVFFGLFSFSRCASSSRCSTRGAATTAR
jgi:phosphatidate cytidylyltransferase